MPPLSGSTLLNNIMGTSTTIVTTEKRTKPIVSNENRPKTVYVWRNIIIFIYVHLGALYGLYLAFQRRLYLMVFFQLAYGFFGGIGITAGAHRLWAHKTYKAKWPMRVLLGIFQTIAFQNHIYEWSRDHRVHHKFSETDADPHNARRGFFFSHIGWLLVRKHPDVKTKGQVVDMSDLDKDFVVVWQRRLYFILMPFFAFYLPSWIAMQLGADGLTAWYSSVTRWVFSLNCTWLVNSAAHLYGNKPYDKTINPSENRLVALLAYGEGWHNYHHTFPYDYKTSELGIYSLNFTTAFIDLFAKIGWAYDLKTVPESVIKRRVERTGDGSHKKFGHDNEHCEVWGWGDKDITKQDLKNVEIINSKSE